ncbi:hypothetical protein Hanom_Chr10g00875671 [Helianthus anomalus]
MVRSFPVAFQYPFIVARLDLPPFVFLISRGLKKNHCRSPVFSLESPAYHKEHILESTVQNEKS